MKLDYSKYSTDKNTVHSYMEVYERIFDKYNAPIDLLEIGVATGGSLKMWKDFFPSGSNICGIDDWASGCPYCVLDPDNVTDCKVYKGDARHHQIKEKFDIIIDDGSHVLEDVVLGIKNFWWNQKNEKESMYIIEDVPNHSMNEWIKEIKDRTNLNIEVIDRTHVKNQFDDIIFILNK